MIASTHPQAPSREMETFKKRKGQFIYAPLDGGVQKRRPLKKIEKCQFDVCHITPNQSQTYQKKSQFLLTQNALPTAAPACPTPFCLILRESVCTSSSLTFRWRNSRFNGPKITACPGICHVPMSVRGIAFGVGEKL
jgi:hypothetical protein